MADITTMKLITLEKLALYHENITDYIDAADAKSLKTVALDGNVLKFYRIGEPVNEAEPAYEIELPEADLTNLLEKFEAATAGHVVTVAEDGKTIADSGVALADLATKEEVETVDGKADKNAEDIQAILNETDGILAQAKAYADGKDAAIEKAQSTADSALEAAQNAQGDVDTLSGTVDEIAENVGNLELLETTGKTDLVTALNEVRNAVSVGGTNSAVTIDTTSTTEGMAKSYTIKQGENVIGTIDIPKDLVVESGEVVTLAEGNSEGQEPGTYIKLVLANSGDVLYVNVGTLVDIYKAKENATQIQVAIDSATREISATIVEGSIGTGELADNAVTTVKIADGNVTKEKLSTTVQASLDKADKSVDTDTFNAAVKDLGDANDELEGRLETVEGLLGDGEGSVSDQIADALESAKNDATTKDTALKTEIEAAYKKYTDDAVNLDRERIAKLETDQHTHANKEELDKINVGDVATWNEAYEKAHEHANKELLDTYTQSDADLAAAVENTHAHENYELLETYRQTEEDLADAVAKKHEHDNFEVLDGITAENVDAWSKAEENAIAKATELDAAMNTRVEATEESTADHEDRLAALESVQYIEATDTEITDLFQ